MIDKTGLILYTPNQKERQYKLLPEETGSMYFPGNGWVILPFPVVTFNPF